MYVVVVVVVLALLGWFGMRGSFLGAVVPGVDVNRHLDGSATYSNENGSVTVGSNSLPSDWPTDVPTYGNGTITFSGASNPKTGEAGLAVMFTTPDAAKTVVDFYKTELAAKGWTIEQTATMGAVTVLSAKKDTRTFGVQISNGGDGKTTVTIGISRSK